jgi:putative PIN family toxin of toxin-antitoxin system
VSITVVYDTMVFLQQASRPGRTHATFQAVTDKRVILAISPRLLAEIRDVLGRDSVRARFPALTSESAKVFVDDVLARSTIFGHVPRAFDWPEHPDDNHLFDLAIHAKANHLVTWESRILKLATGASPAASLLQQLAPGLEIVTPKQLAELIRSSGAT